MRLLIVVLLIATDAVENLGIISESCKRFPILFSAFAMGVANLYIAKKKAVHQNTTMFTCNLQKLGQLFHGILHQESKQYNAQVGIQRGIGLPVCIFGASGCSCSTNVEYLVT